MIILISLLMIALGIGLYTFALFGDWTFIVARPLVYTFSELGSRILLSTAGLAGIWYGASALFNIPYATLICVPFGFILVAASSIVIVTRMSE